MVGGWAAAAYGQSAAMGAAVGAASVPVREKVGPVEHVAEGDQVTAVCVAECTEVHGADSAVAADFEAAERVVTAAVVGTKG